VLDKFWEIFKVHGVEFADARWEHHRITNILFESRERTTYESVSLGGYLRLLVNRNWIHISFNDLNIDNIRNCVRIAIKQANSLEKGCHTVARSKGVKEEIKHYMKRDLASVSLAEKVVVLSEYNKILVDKLKVRSSIAYNDDIVKRQYVNSEGTEIIEKRNQINVTVKAIAIEGTNIQESKDYMATRDYADTEQLSTGWRKPRHVQRVN
jgi:predicted Zn-dependent protease